MSKKNEVRLPDIEIVVQAASSDVAVFSFFAGDTPHDNWEVVAGISSNDDVVHIRASLQAAIQTLNDARWISLDELDTRPVEDENAPPF